MNKFKSWLETYSYIPVAVLFVGLAIYLRLTNLSHPSGDYNQFLQPWMEQIVANGGWASLGVSIGDYSPPYVLILTWLSYFPKPDSTYPYVYVIKYVSVFFDVVMAVGVFFLVATLLKSDKERFWKATLAGTVTLYLPTIFLNSAIWGQADSIYTAFIIWSLYLFAKDKHLWAMVVYGVAFSFKLQAIFVVPFLIMMYVLNRPKQLWHFLVIPVVYFVFCIPALFYGRSLESLAMIYFNQAGSYKRLSLNMPNLYVWFPGDIYRYNLLAPLGFGIFALLMAVAFFFLVNKKIRVRKFSIVDIVLWSVLMANFFLPAMHERYLFIADVMSWVYYVIKKRHKYVPLMINLISLIAYFPFLFGIEPIPHEYAAFGYAALLALVTRQVFFDLEETERAQTSRLA
ncbi:MAG: glycosyltransferase 87 family protein [Bacilli bacterium]|jgi:Gpi18-like mannosyltransferase